MDHLVIEGVPPYDGRYEFDLRDQPFTVREWGWIKSHSGYLPLTLVRRAAHGSDAELMAVFAIIALVRAGKVDRDEVPQVWERFARRPRRRHRPARARARPRRMMPTLRRKLERERQLFWGRFADEFGEIRHDPAGYWDARLGYFGIPPDDVAVGDLTPEQLLDTVDHVPGHARRR